MMRILLEFGPGNVDWIKLQSPASPPEEFVIDGGGGGGVRGFYPTSIPGIEVGFYLKFEFQC
jgi:hypothetical protein